MNPCETAATLLPELWQKQLEAPERAADRLWLRQHLEACTACAGVAAMWDRLGALPPVAPDPRQRQRFDAMLAAYQEGLEATMESRPARGEKSRTRWGLAWLQWHPSPALSMAVLLVVGVTMGWFVRGASVAANVAATARQQQSAQQIADLQQQVQATRQLVVLSMLQQQSANDRLQGVDYTSHLSGADPQVTAALVHSLEYDTSPDVRLAAIDALARHAADPGIQHALVAAFPYQKSPLVQIALVDSFVETHNQQARGLLQQVSQNTTYNPEVRQRAAWSLAQPTWN
jgi:HEAT repeats